MRDLTKRRFLKIAVLAPAAPLLSVIAQPASTPIGGVVINHKSQKFHFIENSHEVTISKIPFPSFDSARWR